MLITIDDFIFEVKHNITGLQKTIKVNYDKQNTITKPIYTHIGGFEEEIQFGANILLNEHAKFKEFEELVKKAEPLKITAFDLVFFKHILIQELSIATDNFFKTSFNGIWYYSKKLNIKGVIV